jgi:endonuclease/exonuclease/phosphatase (EEP) superfamily protein YafD
VGWLATGLVPIEHPAPAASAGAFLAMLMPLVTVFAVPILGLTVVRRRWAWAFTATVIAIAPWLIVLDHVSSAPTGSSPSRTVRVLVVNARNGEVEAGRIVDQVRSQNTDVLIVTELSSALAHDLTVSGIDASLTAASVITTTPVEAGIGVYSRFEVTDVTRVENTQWPAVRATVHLEDATFTLIAAHVVAPTPAKVTAWNEDLTTIRAAANVPGSVVVAGTFNATAWNPQFRELTRNRLRDAAATYGRGLRPTWPNWLPVPICALDHVLATGNIGVDSISSARVDGSDHRSLSAVLAVPRD